MAAKTQFGLSGVLVLVCGIVFFHWTASLRADTPTDETEAKTSTEGLEKAPIGQDIQVPPPPFSEDIFPCMECHEIIDPNPERRPLEEYHEEIVLHHDEENRWCLDCHDAENRDVLRLASGKTIPFEESYKLCGQCHGPKYRDWKAGVHGKRMGRWDGKERHYLLCVHCHNPHDPKFPPIAPMAIPKSPDVTRKLLDQPVEPLELPEPFPKRSSGVVEDE